MRQSMNYSSSWSHFKTIEWYSLQDLKHYLIQISYFRGKDDEGNRSEILDPILAARILVF